MLEALTSYWTIELFGGPQVQQGVDTIRLKTSKTSELLAFLALHPGRYSREYLTELLWPEADDSTTGRASLRTALSSLSRQLEPRSSKGGLFIVDSASIGLDLSQCQVDVKRFKESLSQARRASTLEARMGHYEAAMAIYKAPLLSNFDSEWIGAERRYLAEEAQTTLRQWTEALRETGRYEQAILCARQLVRNDTDSEESTRLLMRLYAETGQKQPALKAFAKLKQALQQRYGLEISPELADLAESIRTSTRRSPQRPSEPSETIAGGRSADSSLRSEPIVSAQSSHIPPRTTVFFGRQEEVWQIVSQLSPRNPPDISQGRLVTLTGMGGIGKTRLAAEAGQLLQERFARFAYVSLANLTDPRWISDAILQALSLPRDPETEAIEQVVESLRAHATLLLLDNIEQLLGSEFHDLDGAAIVRKLLDRLPNLRCLVTSRQPLRIPGEHELSVRPLPIPPEATTALAEFASYPSIQLYVRRAQEKKPDFILTEQTAPMVAALCSRLDGIPLALELAAACVNDYSPARILNDFDNRFVFLKSRFRDHSERHQTLATAIDWSYHTLSPGLQEFFQTLGVFRGCFTAQAAAAVSGRFEALAELEQLKDRSLLIEAHTETDTCFTLLETVRDYARQSLTADHTMRLLRRHAVYYYRLAQRMAFRSDGEELEISLGKLAGEIDNLRACLQFLSGRKLGLRMTGALHQFWYVRGHLEEGLRCMEQMVSQCPNLPVKLRSSVHNGMGVFAWEMGDYARATDLLRQALEDRITLQDDLGVAGLNINLALLAGRQGNLQEASERTQRSVAVYRRLGQPKLLAGALDNLAEIYLDQQLLPAVAPLLEECQSLLEENGDSSILASLLTHRGMLAHRLDDRNRAHAFFQQALRLREALKANSAIASLLLQLALLARERGLMPRAVMLCAAAVRLSETCRFKFDPGDNILLDHCLERARLSLSSNRYAGSWSYGYSLSPPEVVRFACELTPH